MPARSVRHGHGQLVSVWLVCSLFWVGLGWLGLAWLALFLIQMGSCARFRVVTFASPSLEESLAGSQSGGLQGGGGDGNSGGGGGGGEGVGETDGIDTDSIARGRSLSVCVVFTTSCNFYPSASSAPCCPLVCGRVCVSHAINRYFL